MTIRTRLILGIAAIEALFLLIMMAAALSMGAQSAHRRIQVDTADKAYLAAILLRDAVAAGDAAAARDLAGELVAGDRLTSIKVFDRTGALLASANAASPPPRRLAQHQHPIFDGDTVVGAVTVQVSADFLDGVLARTQLKLGLIASGLVLLSIIASWLLGNLMTRRLAALQSSAEAVARGSFELRMQEDGPREIVAVAKAMNAMAKRLGEVYSEISNDLASQKRSLASTFEHMSQGVAIFDADGRLLEANGAFPDLVGLPPEVVVAGVQLDTLVDFHAEAGAYANGETGARLEALCRGRDWLGPSLNFELPFPDGRTISVQRTRLPDGGIIAIHEDISRRLADERRLLHAAKLTTLGRLATAAAHELNQPLNVIRLSADNAAARLTSGSASPEYLAEKLRRISSQTERAARIIDHMRIFGRKPTEAPSIFDLGEAVRSAAEFFGETARLRGFRLEFSLDPHLLVSGHPALIEQVVANILSNAFAALSAGEVAVPAVTVFAARRGGRIRVAIADNAGGVPSDVLPHIFEPFFTTKSDREGTGLGLSISYGIIADMGGRLEAENREGGAVLSFELPEASPSPPAIEARRRPALASRDARRSER